MLTIKLLALFRSHVFCGDKFVKSIIVMLFFLLLPTLSSAIAICNNCKISGVQPDPRRGGTYIFMSGDWNSSVNTCSGTIGLKAFWIKEGSSVEKTMISVALAGLVSQRSVAYAYGNGVCSPHDYEMIDYFIIK